MMKLFVPISDSSQHYHFQEINWFVRAIFFLSLRFHFFLPVGIVIYIYMYKCAISYFNTYGRMTFAFD